MIDIKALDAKDTNDFIDRLHGNNSGKYNYSADKDSYRRNLNGTLSLNKYLKRGGIIKYQNPSSGIKYMGGYDKRGNMVLPVTNENGMNNVTLPEVTVTPRNINLAGAVDRGKRKFLKDYWRTSNSSTGRRWNSRTWIWTCYSYNSYINKSGNQLCRY
ncbi:hypothetical protein [Bacteroides faecis]|uniref:hypothetical protein n=1 Tax=Bacteroides faecis TaxID=674529 RepID=UPI0021663B0D|nr:hypothetical protein [Bacteroides faecis]MCS2914009.1 hypothetical protein [Bacteroides faecis]